MKKFNLVVKMSSTKIKAAHALVNEAMKGWNGPERQGRTQILSKYITADGAVYVDIRHENGSAEQYRPDVYLGTV